MNRQSINQYPKIESRWIRAGLFSVRILCFCLAVAICDSGDASAQESQESLRVAAREALNSGEYQKALTLYSDLSARFPSDTSRHLWIYNQARCRYHLGRRADAKRSFEELNSRYPTSLLAPYSRYFLGLIAAEENRPSDALREFYWSFDRSPNSVLDTLVASGVTLALKQTAIASTKTAPAAPQRRNQLVQLLDPEAQEVFGKLYSGNGGRTPDVKSFAPRLTLALPLSGAYEPLGRKALQGIELAIADAAARGTRLMIQAEDTKGEIAAAAQIGRESQRASSFGVVGPYTADEAIAVSAALGFGDQVAILPTVSSDNIASLSSNVFQLIPTPRMIGERLAEYAFLGLPVRTAAVIAVDNDTEGDIARAFADRFSALGGEVVAMEVYMPNTTDFGGVCRSIKDHYLAEYKENATVINENGDTLELDEAPVKIGCVLVLATPSQMRLTLPQLNYHNIVTTLIGSDGLASPEVWSMKLQNVTKMIFASSIVAPTGNAKYQEFSMAYRDRYGEPPDHIAMLSYDAASLFAEAMNRANGKPENVRSALESMESFVGLSGSIRFNAEHVNSEVPLYILEAGSPVRINWTLPGQTTTGSQ